MTNSELTALVEALRAENEQLRTAVSAGAAVGAGSGSVPDVGGVTRRRAGRGRAAASAALVVVGLLLAPLALVTSWGATQLTDTEAFVGTFAPLARDAAVQDLVVSEVMTVVSEQVDFDATTAQVFDAVGQLGLPPAASSALQALQKPAALGLQSLASSAVSEVVRSPAFADVWEQALRVTHQQLVAALTSDPAAALSISASGELAVQLGPIVQAVRQALITQGLSFAEAIPAVDVSIVIAHSDSLVQLTLAYALAVGLGSWLPWVSLILLAAGVLLARGRPVAVLRTGIALGVVMVLVAVALRIGSLVAVAAIAPRYVPADAAGVLYDTLTAWAAQTAVALAVLAFTVALIAWAVGPLRPAPALRSAFASAAARLRRYGDTRGITTGAIGRRLGRQRRVVEVLIALIGAALILFVRPITVGEVVGTALTVVLLLLLVELLQRPPDELEPDPLTPAPETTVRMELRGRSS